MKCLFELLRMKELRRKSRVYDFLFALGDLLMPRACLACGCKLGMRERHLCLSCAADVPYTRYWRQPHNPLADRFNAVLEHHRGTEPMDYAYAVALMHYKGNYRSIPRALKYHGDLAAGRHFGALLGRRLAAAPHLADIDLVIPVPLHWTRRRSRGYNQSAILARALADAFRDSRCPVAAGHDVPLAAGYDVPLATGHDILLAADHDAPLAAGYKVPLATGHDILLAADHDVPLAAGHDVHLPADHDAPLEAGHDGGTPSSSVSTVTPGLTGSLPACRTDLLVRVRRTRTQTRLSVDQKALNVASAFRVPECFPLWHRLVSRLKRLLLPRHSRIDKRWPIGVDHDGSPHSGRFLSLSKEASESPATVLASARHILLVDDTFTTGATLYACYAALRPYTTARISIATLAAVEGTPSPGP